MPLERVTRVGHERSSLVFFVLEGRRPVSCEVRASSARTVEATAKPPRDTLWATQACIRDPDGPISAANANTIIDILANADVSLERRERIESLARAAVHRGKIDAERLERDEKILGMVLRNRQVEV